MKKTVFLSCLCLLLLVSLAAVPVLAATTVTCPSSCSCLLPAEAKKVGSPGYCQGQQKVCGYDAQKNPNYCYEKPVTITTAPQLIATGFKVVTTTPTTVAPQKCASGCTCLSSADGKGKGLLYCNGKQTVCEGTDKAPLYCFALPAATTTKTVSLVVTGFPVITTTPAGSTYDPNWGKEWIFPLTPCTAPCTCLDPDAAKASGLSRCSVNATLVCGYSTAGKAEYCYTPDRTTGLSSAAGTIIMSTLPACPAGCACLLTDDAKARGLAYCGGKQTTCSVSQTSATGLVASGQTRYCYTIPAATGSVTNLSRVVAVNRTPAAPIPVPKACPSGCSCLDEKTIRDKGYPYCSDTKTECGFSKSGGVLYCAKTGIAAPEPGTAPDGMKPARPDNILSTIESLVMSIFGGNQATVVQGTSILSTYCQDRYGPDYRMCDGDCVDITRSTDNCGGCGNWCNEPAYDNPAYSGYNHCFNGQCVDEYPGANSCSPGGDIDCPAGAPCLRGVCSALGCLDPGLTDCNNTCLDTRTDTENCGSCGHACLPNQTCTDGRCDTQCGFSGYILCPGYDMPYPGLYCTNTSSDQVHCGRCQHMCSSSQECRDGECRNECAPGLTNCGSDGKLRCVNLMTDIFHCGDCDSKCGRIGNTIYGNESCNSGTCTTCPDGGKYCYSTHGCMDPETYERTCGNACPEGTSLCIDLPECVDLMTDERACGDCHNVCTGGDTCIGGTCRAYGYAGMSVPR